jgi:UDPglucose 6-dehydrogenase
MDICVVGLGKLGSPLAAVLSSKGHNVIGIDLNRAYVDDINAGRAPVVEPGLQELIDQSQGRLRATMSWEEAILNTTISFVIVPTPSGPDGLFTNKYVLDAVTRIGEVLRGANRYHVVNITSTVMPGSTAGPIRQALEAASELTVGDGVGLCYNPEFIALGSVVRNMLYPDMILLGESDPKAGDILESVYATSTNNNPPVQRMNLVNAEITKISLNTYVTTKISFANMLAEVCEKIPNADVEVVGRALGKDSRIGSKYITGALGYGGPCFPRDNVAFSAMADGLGVAADLPRATDVINRRQAQRMIEKVRGIAGGREVAVLGMSYKPNTPVVEESQGVMIARGLADGGETVVVYDPLALESARGALRDGVRYAESLDDALSKAGTVIITTPDAAFADVPTRLNGHGDSMTIIDCWRLIDPAATTARVMHVGRG